MVHLIHWNEFDVAIFVIVGVQDLTWFCLRMNVAPVVNEDGFGIVSVAESNVLM